MICAKSLKALLPFCQQLSSNFRKGYIISTNMDEVVAFNHRVMMGMVEVLSKIKEGSSSVTEQLTMMYHSWFPVYDFCNLLVGALSHRSTVDIEPCIEGWQFHISRKPTYFGNFFLMISTHTPNPCNDFAVQGVGCNKCRLQIAV